MCGIVGYVGPQPATTIVFNGLKRLEYRGYDSAGIATIQNGEIVVRRDEGKLHNLEALLRQAPMNGHMAIGLGRQLQHHFAGVDVGFDLSHALGHALGVDPAIEIAQLGHLGLGVPGNAFAAIAHLTVPPAHNQIRDGLESILFHFINRHDKFLGIKTKIFK